MFFFTSPNGIPMKTSFCVALHKPFWKENLIKDTLAQINAQCTSPIKSWICHTTLWNWHQELNNETSIPSEESKYTWPFKCMLSCYSFTLTCFILSLQKGKQKRHSTGLINHTKCSLNHIWRWFCWPRNTLSCFQSNNPWACSHSHSPIHCSWRPSVLTCDKS